LARVLTPNVPEAEALLAHPVLSPADMCAAAEKLREFGVHAALIKGGHLDTRRVHDYFVDDEGVVEFTHRRQNYAVRGTGCTLATALAAGLALGLSPRDATQRAEHYLQNAFHAAYAIGHGKQRVLQHNVSSVGT
jgi:hydroxymethylpyrimidine/phosphomethylpyrimidine kinase